eukprot:2926654-Amphidinium_carterae.1
MGAGTLRLAAVPFKFANRATSKLGLVLHRSPPDLYRLGIGDIYLPCRFRSRGKAHSVQSCDVPFLLLLSAAHEGTQLAESIDINPITTLRFGAACAHVPQDCSLHEAVAVVTTGQIHGAVVRPQPHCK